MNELKPCPFCGGKAEIKDYTDRIYGFWDYQIVCSCGMHFHSPSTAHVVFSSGKMIQTRNEETKKIAYERMIEAWNRRNQPMTDNDIIKALGYCFAVGDCEHCIYADKPCQELMADALDLINRQNAEIEALKLINSTYCAETKRIRDIAFREFAEKIKDIGLYRYVEEHYKNAEFCCEVRQDRFCKDIDNLVKEMTEE